MICREWTHPLNSFSLPIGCWSPVLRLSRFIATTIVRIWSIVWICFKSNMRFVFSVSFLTLSYFSYIIFLAHPSIFNRWVVCSLLYVWNCCSIGLILLQLYPPSICLLDHCLTSLFSQPSALTGLFHVLPESIHSFSSCFILHFSEYAIFWQTV